MLPPSLRTRLEKTATDNGFHIRLSFENDWIAFASSQTPLRLWLSADAEKRLLVAFSQANIADELPEHHIQLHPPLPPGAKAMLFAPDIPALDRLLRRMFQLSITLPDELLHLFERQTANLPKTTEVERLVVQRVGQELFRAALRNYWEDRCAISGLGVPELLRASHIKPWADCETDAERLDVYNGLLLAPQFDAAFDLGFITINDAGEVLVGAVLPDEARSLLGFDRALRVQGALRDEHRAYLAWHRERVFRKDVR
ncbi:MAG TPA: HNH endonuclease [Polyangium sp.]|nr:HNH endonuclease [Polyangium sp.]